MDARSQFVQQHMTDVSRKAESIIQSQQAVARNDAEDFIRSEQKKMLAKLRQDEDLAERRERQVAEEQAAVKASYRAMETRLQESEEQRVLQHQRAEQSQMSIDHQADMLNTLLMKEKDRAKDLRKEKEMLVQQLQD